MKNRNINTGEILNRLPVGSHSIAEVEIFFFGFPASERGGLSWWKKCREGCGYIAEKRILSSSLARG